MSRILVDSNVLLDVFEDDANWADWSESMLDYYRSSHVLCINPVIYAEIWPRCEHSSAVKIRHRRQVYKL